MVPEPYNHPVDQFTPDSVEAGERALGGPQDEVPTVPWALNHDLPGGGGAEVVAEAPAAFQPAFPMEPAAPEPEEPPKRDWVSIAIGSGVAVLLMLLALWLLGYLDGGGDAADDAAGEVVEVREIVAESGATSAAAVGEKVTPSVVTVEIGDTGADGNFEQAGLGSGVVLRADGFIVTNHHVVEEAARIRVIVQDGTTYDAQLIGSDARTDLAVVAIPTEGLTEIELGRTDELAIGDTAIAVGNPLGLAGGASLTVGVLSAFEREVNTSDSGTLFGMLQTDAPITRGSSGGALVDANGRLIGITTAIGVSSAGAEGIGFAVPVEVVDRITQELIETGDVKHAFLGVRLDNYLESSEGGGSRPAGALVESFPEGVDSAAAGAGLRVNDVIVGLNGDSVTTRDDLISALRRFRVGDSVNLDVQRNGETLNFDVILGERPDDL